MKGKARAGSRKATAESSSADLSTPTKPRELGVRTSPLCVDKMINNPFLVYSLRPLDRGKAASPAPHVLCSAVTAATVVLARIWCSFSHTKALGAAGKLKARSFLAKPDLHKPWISPKMCKAGLKLAFPCLRAEQALKL